MIISCNNCNKKFEVNSDLIPEEGRLLQCSVCNHEWFFKTLISKNLVKTVESSTTKIFDSTRISKENELDIESNFVDKEILNNDKPQVDVVNNDKKKWKNSTNTNKNREKVKKFNILNLIIVLIISFIALVILIDTFKSSISIIIPNIEIILYNLYETIKDIELFFKDLI
jgi:predicted Zn finger-like uncharacterized protein